jgi:hypothetical protein
VTRISIPLAVAALVSLLLGVALALLALDIRRWNERLDAASVRWTVDASKVSQTVPLGAARRLLGIDDDLRWHETLRVFRLAGLRSDFRTPFQQSLQSEAEFHLARVMETEDDDRRRSLAATLRGIVAFESGRIGSDRGPALRRSVAEFQKAIELDPANDVAKYNLELTLRLLRSGPPARRRGRGRRSDLGAGAGTRTPGSGY